MTAAFADSAERAGVHLVCRQGCTQCCNGVFALNPLDTLRLRSGMDILRATEPALAAQIEGRARAWVSEHGTEFPGDAETGEAACPALDETSGRCDVYAYRPMTCRAFGPPVRVGDGDALAHCELCFTGAEAIDVVACEMTVPHDLEAELLEEIPAKEETVVAYALLG
jgi:Fe-S-cluster containining protein